MEKNKVDSDIRINIKPSHEEAPKRPMWKRTIAETLEELEKLKGVDMPKTASIDLSKVPPLTKSMTLEEIKESVSLFKEKGNMKKKEPKKRNNIPWDIKKDNNLLKTIIISVTVFLSAAMISYSYYKSNQYSVNNSTIIDKYNGTWKSPNFRDNEVREIIYKK